MHREPEPVDTVYGTLSLDVSTDEVIRALRDEPILDSPDETERLRPYKQSKQ